MGREGIQVSTFRLAERNDCVDVDATEAWVEVVAPAETRSQPNAPGVVLSIAEARHRYNEGVVDEIEVDDSELAPLDEGDREMADYFDSVWDR
jgi:hypothetical protein